MVCALNFLGPLTPRLPPCHPTSLARRCRPRASQAKRLSSRRFSMRACPSRARAAARSWYDDESDEWIVRGDKGYFYLPYDYLVAKEHDTLFINFARFSTAMKKMHVELKTPNHLLLRSWSSSWAAIYSSRQTLSGGRRPRKRHCIAKTWTRPSRTTPAY